MSENKSQLGEFWDGLRNTILNGESVYGAADSPAAKAKLAELDAKLSFGRSIGELPPAPEWSPERVATDRLQAEWPGGDPGDRSWSDMLTASMVAKVEAAGALDDQSRQKVESGLVKDLADRTSAMSIRYSGWRRGEDGGRYLTGPETLSGLLADAQPAVEQFAAQNQVDVGSIEKLLRADRDALELFAVRGASMTAYIKRRQQFGMGG